MYKFVRKFLNEFNHEITMSVEWDDRGVTVVAIGPDSTVEHTWTPFEAHVLRWLLADERVVLAQTEEVPQ